ncbi:MAG: flagellar basal body rod C-terminal domain-containing protein, partial [Vulcanimicrobiaceae bacterium]
ALRSLGGTIFEATRASGSPRVVVAGSHGSGAVAFGMLEKSNVSIMEAMMEILNAQRAFEANAKGAQAADEMQRIANNINRG